MSNPFSGTIEFFADQFMLALGRGDPWDGMRASAILFAITFASNAIGLWFTIILDVLFALLFLYNAGRLAVASRRS